MYLTNDEFLMLQSIKQKLTRQQMKEIYYGITLYTNDPRVHSLCQKYGVDICDSNWRTQLSQKADLNKVEVCTREDIPYFDYDRLELVKKIPISKADVLQLLKAFETLDVFNDTDEYLLQYSPYDGLGSGIHLIDKNDVKHHIRSWIDGDIYEGENETEVN